MKLNFIKMHGAGNDYVYVDGMKYQIPDESAAAKKLSDRHFSVGGDGLIIIKKGTKADFEMVMYNPDGSRGAMCGNGIRCVGKFLYDHNIVDQNKETVTVETLSGIKTLKVYKQDNEVKRLRVDMGKAELNSAKIPVAIDKERVINEPVIIDGQQFNITCVSMGNPHCVVFINDVEGLDIEKIGPKFEHDKLFPERVNTEFVRVINENTIKMRVWERGSGETWACGTGACAVAVAAVENGFCKKGEDITVQLKGGDLVINYTDDTVYMTGAAERVFEGTVEL